MHMHETGAPSEQRGRRLIQRDETAFARAFIGLSALTYALSAVQHALSGKRQ